MSNSGAIPLILVKKEQLVEGKYNKFKSFLFFLSSRIGNYSSFLFCSFFPFLGEETTVGSSLASRLDNFSSFYFIKENFFLLMEIIRCDK